MWIALTTTYSTPSFILVILGAMKYTEEARYTIYRLAFLAQAPSVPYHVIIMWLFPLTLHFCTQLHTYESELCQDEPMSDRALIGSFG